MEGQEWPTQLSSKEALLSLVVERVVPPSKGISLTNRDQDYGEKKELGHGGRGQWANSFAKANGFPPPLLSTSLKFPKDRRGPPHANICLFNYKPSPLGGSAQRGDEQFAKIVLSEKLIFFRNGMKGRGEN